ISSTTGRGIWVLLSHPQPHLCFAFTDVHSLCYNFTVHPKPRPGQPWCVFQGQVDGKVFLSYDCGGAKIQSMSPLGEEMETLKDVGDLLKEQLPDVTPEKHAARGEPCHPAGQDDVRCEDDGRTSGSWQFGFNGRMWLLFDSENGQWTVVPSGSRRMKEKWESDRAVTKFFKKTSMGDCRAWLQDFLVHWEKMLKTRASPTTDPPKAQSRATAIKPIAWILPVVLSCSITTGILGGVLYKNRY
uniref:MHC class I-like antigen recognition-like domain-containing protein n=1 Tax=Balaenoptera musculus TaxID=9771 RepID=A0A8C0HZB2_BALMU